MVRNVYTRYRHFWEFLILEHGLSRCRGTPSISSDCERTQSPTDSALLISFNGRIAVRFIAAYKFHLYRAAFRRAAGAICTTAAAVVAANEARCSGDEARRNLLPNSPRCYIPSLFPAEMTRRKYRTFVV